MTSKKKLKRRNKKLKAGLAEREEMYETLQDDYHGYVGLYHDVIGLLAKFDAELLLEVVKTTLLNSDEANLQTRLDVSEPGDVIYVQGKTPKVKAWLNGDPIEIGEAQNDQA